MTTQYDESEANFYGFVLGETIRVTFEGAGGLIRTIECLTYKSEDDGIRVIYSDLTHGTVRSFIPTHRIIEIYQLVQGR